MWVGGRQDSYIVFRWKIVINGDWWVILLLYVEVKMGNLDNWTPRFKSLSIDFENPHTVDTVGLSCHLCTVKYYWENIDKKFSLNIWLSKKITCLLKRPCTYKFENMLYSFWNVSFRLWEKEPMYLEPF